MRWAALVCFSVTCAVGCSGGAEPWKAKLPDIGLSSSKGEKATLLSELRPGPYQPSTVAIGEEQDLARQRAQPFGFVRQARLEEFLSGTRARLLAVSGKTGVPGQVRIVASQEFNAYSTADGNVYISMRCIEELENLDEVAAILAHEMSHVLLTRTSSQMSSIVVGRCTSWASTRRTCRTATRSPRTATGRGGTPPRPWSGSPISWSCPPGRAGKRRKRTSSGWTYSSRRAIHRSR